MSVVPEKQQQQQCEVELLRQLQERARQLEAAQPHPEELPLLPSVTDSPPSSPEMLQPLPNKDRGRGPRKGRQCDACHTTETPMWRRGGKGTLCNACGVRWSLRKKRPPRPGLEGEAAGGEILSPLSELSDDPAAMLDDEATDPAIAALRSKRESDKQDYYYCRYCDKTWPLNYFRNSQQFGAHCSNCSRKKRPTPGEPEAKPVKRERRDRKRVKRERIDATSTLGPYWLDPREASAATIPTASPSSITALAAAGGGAATATASARAPSPTTTLVSSPASSCPSPAASSLAATSPASSSSSRKRDREAPNGSGEAAGGGLAMTKRRSKHRGGSGGSSRKSDRKAGQPVVAATHQKSGSSGSSDDEDDDEEEGATWEQLFKKLKGSVGGVGGVGKAEAGARPGRELSEEERRREVELLEKEVTLLRYQVRLKEHWHKKSLKEVKHNMEEELHELQKDLIYSFEVAQACIKLELESNEKEETQVLLAFARQVSLPPTPPPQSPSSSTPSSAGDVLQPQTTAPEVGESSADPNACSPCNEHLDKLRRDGEQLRRSCHAQLAKLKTELEQQFNAKEETFMRLLSETKAHFSSSTQRLRRKITDIEAIIGTLREA